MTKSPSRLNFDQVEELRKGALLSINQMVDLLHVSRVTYFRWRRGEGMDPLNQELAPKRLLPLSTLFIEGDGEKKWPFPGVADMSSQRRFEVLKEAIAKFESNPQ